MSVQALISSCATEEPPCDMEKEDVGRGAPGWVVQGLPCSLKGPAQLLLSSPWLHEPSWPFCALSSTAKSVSVVCGAEDVFSRGAVVWTVGWVPKSTPASVWDSWVQTHGRGSTSLVTSTAGSWLSPGQVSDVFLSVGLQNANSSSFWELSLHVKQTPGVLCL